MHAFLCPGRFYGTERMGLPFASLFVFVALTMLSYLRFSPFLVSTFQFLVFLSLPISFPLIHLKIYLDRDGTDVVT